MQFYTEEGMTIAGVIVLVALAGYDGLTPRWLPPYIIGVAVILILYLLYRYLYVTRTVYVITSEQLKYECGVFSCSRDFIELYRVIDYSEQRSFLQILLGIKTISIYSGDRTHPRLDLVGISNKVDLISTIRERVELNKSVTTYMNLRTHKTFRKLENRLFPFGKDDANGKWLIVSVVALILLLITSSRTYGQVVTSNPGEYTILATGNNLINGTVKSETQAQRNTALAQNVMAGEFTKMKQWEKDYNSYLKTATNYASALKAATHIYDDGVRILLTLGKLRKAVNNNPQGIAATVSMNNLYMETTTEMLSVFTLLKDAIAKGGSTNMLTGAERSKTLWELEDKLSSFSHKLHLLYISIRHYRMSDVWNRATAGMIERDKHEVALQSFHIGSVMPRKFHCIQSSV